MKRILLLAFATFIFTLCEGQFNVLHNFNGTTGGNPYNGLTLSGNVFYGMTNSGGAHDSDGCIFSMNTDGSNYKDIFDFDGINGAKPYGSLLISGNIMYGMTYTGELSEYYGSIFSIHTDGRGYKILYNFSASFDANPNGSLILSGKKLFGVATGKRDGNGNIFSIDTDGSNYKNLYEFNGPDGISPTGNLILSDNVLYGMTFYGGIPGYGDGCVFSIDTDGSGFQDLLIFDDTNGASPYGSLTLSGNVLYGMTCYGGDMSSFPLGYGTIFSIHTDGRGYKNLLDFNGSNGGNPEYGSTLIPGNVLYSGSVLYGKTPFGGANNRGCIFSIDTDGNVYKDLYDFNSAGGGAFYSQSSLTLSGTLLYGMTYLGGMYNQGVIFSLNYINAGINNLNSSASPINIYPNPSNGQFTIKYSAVNSNSSVEVYNVLGEQVYSQVIVHSSSFIVDLSNQPNGIYLYRVIGEDGELIGEGKLVIQK